MNTNINNEAFVRGFSKAASDNGLSQGQILDLLTALQTPVQKQASYEVPAADMIAQLLAKNSR